MNKSKDDQKHEKYVKYVRDTVKHKYKNVWLWDDAPDYIFAKIGFKRNYNADCDDENDDFNYSGIGCDLICEVNDPTFHVYEYIQCKNYSTINGDNIIDIPDLGEFYMFIAENHLVGVSYVYYSGKLSELLLSRANNIKYINLPMIKP